MTRRMIMCIFVILIFVATLIGCGGGFDHDSDNAKNIEKSIFGPDTIPGGND